MNEIPNNPLESKPSGQVDPTNEHPETIPGTAVSRQELASLKWKENGNEAARQNSEILLNKLEHGALDLFDQESILLLQAVFKDNNKKTIFNKLGQVLGPTFYPIFEFAASKVAGYEGAVYAAGYGKQIYTHKTEEYLKKKLMDPLILDENGWFAKMKHQINEGTQAVLKPLIDSASNTAGKVAEVPYAVGGFLAVSAIVGGAIHLYRETRRTKGFDQIQEIIEKSRHTIRSGQKDEQGNDPRLSLIVLQRKILEDPKRMGHKLNNEDWLELAAAVREAKVDLLRKQTKGAEIQVAPGLKEAAEVQNRAVETIVKAQQGIAEADRELALEILAQFDRKLNEDTEPVEKRFKNYNSLARKSGRYIKAFASGAVEGTGIPVLYRMAKWTLKAGVKIIAPI